MRRWCQMGSLDGGVWQHRRAGRGWASSGLWWQNEILRRCRLLLASLPSVACEWDPDFGDDQAVELVSNDHETRVRLWNRVDPWGEGSIQICVEAGGDGLCAAAHGVTLAFMGDTLTPFLDHLADQFAGWDGALSWSSLEPGLGISAAHHSRGHVVLSWTVGPADPPAAWSASVEITVEAGEQLRRFASDVSRFLNPAT